MEILSPAAAVGLRALDPEKGTAVFTVSVLSPRILGGWCCQVWAARAVQALSDGSLTCEAAAMEYLSGSDCFCVALTVRQKVVRQGESWVLGSRWQVQVGTTVREDLVSFRAVRSQGRRTVGALNQGAPAGVTPGRGGWELELVQRSDREAAEPEEPFTLTLREDGRVIRYTGCRWNETVWDHDQSGLLLTRRGFALGREVSQAE